ncbi:hypothetical protein DFS34DRAFT_658581 [Phlyctochytrium arcticum]|nr:hypothetical protein DFS34DRAFT_658581 [Phlyctochytrium arcticum]
MQGAGTLLSKGALVVVVVAVGRVASRPAGIQLAHGDGIAARLSPQGFLVLEVFDGLRLHAGITSDDAGLVKIVLVIAGPQRVSPSGHQQTPLLGSALTWTCSDLNFSRPFQQFQLCKRGTAAVAC